MTTKDIRHITNTARDLASEYISQGWRPEKGNISRDPLIIAIVMLLTDGLPVQGNLFS